MSNKIIVDIDQDFFFFPIKYEGDANNLLSKEELEWKKNNQKEILSIENFLADNKLLGYQYVIFRDHEQAFHYIKNMHGKIDKLIHYDAHHDVKDEGYPDLLLIGNWIKFLLVEGICESVDWIAPDDMDIKAEVESDYELTEDYVYKSGLLNIYNYKNYKLEEKPIDILYTVSDFYCPPNNVAQRFIDTMEKDPRRKNDFESRNKDSIKFIWKEY